MGEKLERTGEGKKTENKCTENISILKLIYLLVALN